MELSDIPKHPTAEKLGLDLDEYETYLLYKCCDRAFEDGLITDDNGYDGDVCPKCEEEDPEILRRVKTGDM